MTRRSLSVTLRLRGLGDFSPHLSAVPVYLARKVDSTLAGFRTGISVLASVTQP